MTIDDIIAFLTVDNLVHFFFKAFALLFSFMFLIYSIVVYKQTQVMIKTIESSRSGFIIFVSFIQIIIGIALVILALFLV